MEIILADPIMVNIFFPVSENLIGVVFHEESTDSIQFFVSRPPIRFKIFEKRSNFAKIKSFKLISYFIISPPHNQKHRASPKAN